MRALHLFGDIYEEAVREARSAAVEFSPDRSAPDGIGPHWYGMRCHLTGRTTGLRFYLHTGLIFLPETKKGLMVELDRNSNESVFADVWEHVGEGPLYVVNKDEEEYLKLFMPEETFASLERMDRAGQKETLSTFFVACAEEIARAAGGCAFRLSESDLSNMLALARAFERCLEGEASDEYAVGINRADGDNFGQYASGYRYWLSDKKGDARMYAYFGAIYSYKKDPAGVFVEIDRPSNQSVFERVHAAVRQGESYQISGAEPDFIKLFLTESRVKAFNAADRAAQEEIVGDFLHECNTMLTFAARGR
jgi:hypothetical protein